MLTSQLRHELTVNSAGFGRASDVKVTFSGEGAYTDGSTINIPSISERKLSVDEERTFRGYVDHESGHLRHSNMPLLMDKYDKWCNSGHQGLKDIQNSLEDMWLEAKVMDEYQGSRKNLKAVTESVNAMELEAISKFKEAGEITELPTDTSDVASLAITSHGRKEYGGKFNEELRSHVPEKMRAHADKWIEEVHKCKDTGEVIDLAKKVYQHLIDDPESESDPEDFGDQQPYQGGEGEGEGEGNEGGGDPTKGSPKPNGDAEQGTTQGEGTPDKEGIKLSHQPSDALSKEAGKGYQPPNGCYQGDYTILTTEWDAYPSRKNPVGAQGALFLETSTIEYDRIRKGIGSNISVMKNKLARALISKQKRDWDTGRIEGRLDTKRLVAGYLGAQSVYKQRQDRQELDTAVSLLIDMSGSMCETKIKVATQCAISMAECLEKSGIPFNISGFTTNSNDEYYEDYYSNEGIFARGGLRQSRLWGRIDPQSFITLKDFNDSLRSTRPYLGAVGSSNFYMGANCDSESVLWAGYTLNQRTESRKVLFVFSDGQPAYSTDAGSEQVGKWTKGAVKTIEGLGVETVGIGIQNASVEKFYDDNYVVHDIEDFTGSVFNKLTKKLLRDS